MSIAEKLQTIAENQQNVYNAGYEKGKAEGGGSGGSAENWWQNMAQSRTDWRYLCYKSNIEETPQDLDTSSITSMSNMFNGCVNLKTVHKLETSNVTDMTHLFNGCSKLEIIPELDLQNCTSIQEAFISCTSIKTIKLKNTGNARAVNWAFQGCVVETLGVLDLSSVSTFNCTFNYCDKLTNIEIVAGTIKASINFGWSGLLTDESIQSIIDGLADLTGQTAQTISWHSTVINKMTPEQYSQIMNKNWKWN